MNPTGRGSAPSPAADVQCERLRSQLGPFGYQWLCACAIYPKLRFSLSTWLGRTLAARLGRPAPDEDEHLALFRLPWFRQGWMPEDLRVRLLRDLDEEVQKELREAIEALLYSVVAHPTASSEGLAAVDKPPLRWRSMLRAYLDNAPRDVTESDAVFIRYMKGRPVTPTALARESRLVRLFGRRALALLDWRNALVVAAAAAIAIAWATADWWLKPAFIEERVVQEVVRDTPVGDGNTARPPDEEVRDSDIETPPAEFEKPSDSATEQVQDVGNAVEAWVDAAGNATDPESGYSTPQQGPPQSGPGAADQGLWLGRLDSPSGAGGAQYGEAVRRLQDMLRAERLYSQPSDGIAGPATVEAIRAYQRRNGMEPTGIVTEELLKSLRISPTDTAAN